MKTSELICHALDWAVAKCEGKTYIGKGQLNDFRASRLKDRNTYSVSWSQGGPIIEREQITISPYSSDEEGNPCEPGWVAFEYIGIDEQHGPTPLVAAMRCYVASKLGDEVEIPEKLL